MAGDNFRDCTKISTALCQLERIKTTGYRTVPYFTDTLCDDCGSAAAAVLFVLVYWRFRFAIGDQF